MFLAEVAQGSRFRILALGCDRSEGREKIPYLDFREQLARKRPRELEQLDRIFDRAKEHGPGFANFQARRLRDAEVFEFRSRGGARLFWCFGPDRSIVCLNGYLKQGRRAPTREVEQAKRLLRAYRRSPVSASKPG